MKGNARNTNHPALKFRRVAWERIIHTDALLRDGKFPNSVRLSGLDEIERSVLNWGRHATIIRPRALAERVRRTAEDLAMRYAESSEQLPQAT